MLTRIRARLPLGRDPSKTSKKKTKIQKMTTKNTKTTIDFCSPRGATQSTLIPELRTAHKHKFNSVDFFFKFAQRPSPGRGTIRSLEID